jgi:hypothetical protein
MQTIFRRSGSNSQKTKCWDIININLLMFLFVEEIAIYFEVHAKDANTPCEQNEELCSLNHLDLIVGLTPVNLRVMQSSIQFSRKRR